MERNRNGALGRVLMGLTLLAMVMTCVGAAQWVERGLANRAELEVAKGERAVLEASAAAIRADTATAHLVAPLGDIAMGLVIGLVMMLLMALIVTVLLWPNIQAAIVARARQDGEV